MTTESSTPTAEERRADLLVQAVDYGFRIEEGVDLEDTNLFGKFWWSLSRPGWREIEVSDDEWLSRRECEDAIIVAHAEALMDPGAALTAGDEFPEPHMERRP